MPKSLAVQGSYREPEASLCGQMPSAAPQSAVLTLRTQSPRSNTLVSENTDTGAKKPKDAQESREARWVNQVSLP